MIKLFKDKKGQSLVEVIIAMAIFALISSAIMSVTMGSLNGLTQGGDETEAQGLAQEGMEAIRSIRDGAWNELVSSPAKVSISGSTWALSSGSSELINNKYTRTITLSDVCRDGSNSIVNCPGIYTDPHTKFASTTVSWLPRFNATNTIEQYGFITNWESQDWVQTNWVGGSGQSVWSDVTKYFSDDSNLDITILGEIKLKELVNSGSAGWPFSTSTDYTYNASKISVTGDKAQLVNLGGGGSCSGTPNACNTFSTSPSCSAQLGCSWTPTSGSSPAWSTTWGTYADWENGGNASGASPTTGGNPTNYKNITITRNASAQTASGYWQQAFTTTVANPTTATINFDWSIKSYNAQFLTSYIIYVFVDNFNGAPIVGNQVWSQTVTGTTGWATVSNLNVASKLTTAGTYYIKLVARRIKPVGNPVNTNNTVGWDNVSLNWSNNLCSGTPNACNTFVTSPACTTQLSCTWSTTPSYPTDNPSINPTATYTGTGINFWTGFTETATKGTGEIYYQLSVDGSNWKYWNGSSWATAGVSNYNTANIINTNIGTFATSTGQIVFKAFLASDGNQQVALDNVSIGYLGGSGSYASTGSFISSAFNMNNNSPVQVVDWDEVKPANTNIKLQVQTAPDAGGVPGTWTSWFGASGAGTYFTNHYGSIISALLNGNQWVQYRVELSGDGTDTPVLQEVRVNYK